MDPSPKLLDGIKHYQTNNHSSGHEISSNHHLRRVLGFFQIPPAHSQRRIVEAQGQRCSEVTPGAGSIGGGGLDVGELVEPWTDMRKVVTVQKDPSIVQIYYTCSK